MIKSALFICIAISAQMSLAAVTLKKDDRVMDPNHLLRYEGAATGTSADVYNAPTAGTVLALNADESATIQFDYGRTLKVEKKDYQAYSKAAAQCPNGLRRNSKAYSTQAYRYHERAAAMDWTLKAEPLTAEVGEGVVLECYENSQLVRFQYVSMSFGRSVVSFIEAKTMKHVPSWRDHLPK
jgi:hypothetical protein